MEAKVVKLEDLDSVPEDELVCVKYGEITIFGFPRILKEQHDVKIKMRLDFENHLMWGNLKKRLLMKKKTPYSDITLEEIIKAYGELYKDPTEAFHVPYISEAAKAEIDKAFKEAAKQYLNKENDIPNNS